MSSSTHKPSYHAPSKRSRSPSVSASSIVTVQKPDPSSAYTRNVAPHRPSEDSRLTVKLPTSTFSRSSSPNAVPVDAQISDGVGNLNRWSQSTTSSASPLDSPHRRTRTRTNSGTAGGITFWNQQRNPNGPPPASPQREEVSPRTVMKQPPKKTSPLRESDQHRRNAPSLDKPLPPTMPALAALHIPVGPVASPSAESDLLLTGNSITPSSTGLLTPLSYSAFDYFGSGATSAPSKREASVAPLPHTHHASIGDQPQGSLRQAHQNHQHHPSSSIED